MKLPPISINLVSLWKIIKAIRKFLHDQKVNAGKLKNKVMCIRWFKKSEPIVSDQMVVSIVCGNYPGTANDLQGPPYDQIDYKKRILSDWPKYVFREFKDNQSTTSQTLTEIKNVVNRMKKGDLLFFVMDNCFSESNTRNLSNFKTLQSRVYHNPKFPKHKKKVNKVISAGSDGLNYISMSACLDHETASDAYFDHPNGAYTYCLLNTLEKGITYRQWDEKTGKKLKELGFDQTCTIEGPDSLLDRKVFEGVVYNIFISSHGSHEYSNSEPDMQNEGPYLYNGFLPDDKIAEILSKIPK